MENSIQLSQPSGGALSAEHYQTFEMAKENDSVLGGDNIAQIRSYAAYARAQAQAIHKTIAATSGIEDVATIKAEMTETEQTYARVSIYADQRIGELLRELPKAKNQHDMSDLPVGKMQAIEDAGFTPKTAHQLEQLASHPDVVQAVLDKAEADGTIPSRSQVLQAIKERDKALGDAETARRVGDKLKQERDTARADLQDAYREIEALEKQNDSLYEQAHAEPTVVEREVMPADYADAKKRARDLEHERDLYLSDLQRMRKRNEDLRGELDKAKSILGMNQTMQNVRQDVQYLITATNSYVRQYGGLTWTAASLEQVDEPTLEEFRKAVTNLATFANALVACLEDING